MSTAGLQVFAKNGELILDTTTMVFKKLGEFVIDSSSSVRSFQDKNIIGKRLAVYCSGMELINDGAWGSCFPYNIWFDTVTDGTIKWAFAKDNPHWLIYSTEANCKFTMTYGWY